ncbi:hypothetical protein EUX98_g9012 [Antrodiella citrinella]|uniref:Peptidase C14 caspase domain-containing protein n=1 Tax=Antrodiella citrinella TaxID=2447956 RepID=A0A4S4LZK9_9APHY|nr:hypothetical protein EUX98_g9012 [Antrodiella citrinella]
MPDLWAFVVSIETYAHPDWPRVKGATNDGNRTVAYLQTDRNVPTSHILRIQDAQATRHEIIAAFKRHLVDNPEIKHGDAILFHYSGHGSRSPAPKNWPVIEEGGDEEGGDETKGPKLEMITPYDESTLDENGTVICGIPDRTLGVLLDLVSERHGDNVTVVLDCCHSGSGTRGESEEENPFQARGLDPSLVTPLREDVDKHLWDMEVLERRKPRKGAFTGRRAKSHVLMAACGQYEEALGDTRSGLLTTY